MDAIRSREVVSSFLSGLCFVCSFGAAIKFLSFLSNPTRDSVGASSTSLAYAQDGNFTNTLFALFINSILILLFLFQQSVTSLIQMRYMVGSESLPELFHSMYILGSSLSLIFLIKNWTFTLNHTLWSINANQGFLWWFFTLTHCVLWGKVCAGLFFVDITEILARQRNSNLFRRLRGNSNQLRVLYSFVLHPSFLGIFCIFWFYPVMSDMLLQKLKQYTNPLNYERTLKDLQNAQRYDRLLIGAILTIYICLACRSN